MTHVVFIHLDLGIGGAESLVINLAKATLPSNNKDTNNDNLSTVSIYTTHCSPSHCYDEVKPPSGPLSPHVYIRGSWIPRSLSSHFTALCSSIRMLYLTIRAYTEHPDADVFVMDVLPTGVPYLILWRNVMAGVLFYCHFPDKLLTRDTVNGEECCITTTTDSVVNCLNEREKIAGTKSVLARMKTWYRWCLDAVEECTMNYSDLIVVNSNFTMGEVEKVFPSLFVNNSEEEDDDDGNRLARSKVQVLYPAIESSLSCKTNNNNNNETHHDNLHNHKNNSTEEHSSSQPLGPIVSLNRFERKKNIPLLLHAYALLLERAQYGQLEVQLPPLIIAGGYDPLNVENVEHMAELRLLANQILARFDLPPSLVVPSSKDDDIASSRNGRNNATITFYPSISNEKRCKLLSSASVWCYTPHREHFGIVPLEAMNAGVPVVAIRSGGPMETIVDGVTGYLVDYEPLSTKDEARQNNVIRNNVTVKGFADSIAKILLNRQEASRLGQNGRKRVHDMFGMETFRKQWWELLNEAQKRGKRRHLRRNNSYPRLIHTLFTCVLEVFLVLAFALALVWILKSMGFIEEDRGIFGTVRLLIQGEEL